jgi:ABC-type multidrug transport system permease subunit
MAEIYAVFWGDLRYLRRRLLRTIATSLVSPILYLVAFGWGLGRGAQMGGADYLQFVIPGIVALTAMNTCFNATGTKLNVARLFYKTFDEYLMAPISTWSLVVGKSVVGVIRGLISSAAMIVLALVISRQTNFGPMFFVSLLITCFTFAFMGLFVALLAKSHEDMSTFSTFVILPMTFLCGTFFSVDQLPTILQVVLYALPLTDASQCLRAVCLQQPFPWLPFVILCGYLIAFYLACQFVIKRMSV